MRSARRTRWGLEQLHASARFPRLLCGFLLGAGVVATTGGAHADASKLPAPIVYNYGENETARSGAMGGALRALGSGTTGMLLNPADLVATRLYHIEAQGQVAPETGRQVYGGSIVDSVTGRLGGGISIMGGFMDPDGLNRSVLEVRLAVAYPITERLFVGIGGRYAKVVQNGPGESGASPGPFGSGGAGGTGKTDRISGGLVDPEGGRFALVNRLNLDAGLTIKATDNLYIGVLGQNLAYAGNGLLPTMMGGGVGYGNKDFSVEVDGLCDFNSWAKATARVSVGGEVLIANHVPVRLGYKYDQGADLHTLSGGSGFISTEFSVEASVKRTLSDPGATTIMISVAYFLESSGLTKTRTDF